MSFSMHGIAVSGGIAIGYAHLVSHASLEVAHYSIPLPFVTKEIERFDAAVATVHRELSELLRTAPSSAPAEFTAFVDLHGMILEDPLLTVSVRDMIKAQHCNAEWALKQQMDALIEQFDSIDDDYLRERKVDVRQVTERVLKALMGYPGQLPVPPAREDSSILVAHDLSPADMILFKQHDFAGFITDLGGATSHTAILARSIAIPSVVALHISRQLIEENELLIIDGTQGVVIVNPDKTILAEYKLRQQQFDLEKQKLKRLRTTKTTTVDGTAVHLFANIELPSDLDDVRDSGAAGIGLFRSEFLFLNRSELPTEDEQFEAYRTVAEKMRGKPVTIRTLDLGADKSLAGRHPIAQNPALGLRAIRYCLAEPQMFMTQLRAILRASQHGRVCILLPMLSTLSELTQALLMIEEAKQQLREQKLPFWEKVPVGGMVEIPAAALALSMFAPKLDRLQRFDPVHARHRPRRRRRGASLQSAASGGADAHRAHGTSGGEGGHPAGRVRRNRRRSASDPCPPGSRHPPTIHAPRTAVAGQAASAEDQYARCAAAGAADFESGGAGADSGSGGQIECLVACILVGISADDALLA